MIDHRQELPGARPATAAAPGVTPDVARSPAGRPLGLGMPGTGAPPPQDAAIERADALGRALARAVAGRTGEPLVQLARGTARKPAQYYERRDARRRTHTRSERRKAKAETLDDPYPYEAERQAKLERAERERERLRRKQEWQRRRAQQGKLNDAEEKDRRSALRSGERDRATAELQAMKSDLASFCLTLADLPGAPFYRAEMKALESQIDAAASKSPTSILFLGFREQVDAWSDVGLRARREVVDHYIAGVRKNIADGPQTPNYKSKNELGIVDLQDLTTGEEFLSMKRDAIRVYCTEIVDGLPKPPKPAKGGAAVAGPAVFYQNQYGVIYVHAVDGLPTVQTDAFKAALDNGPVGAQGANGIKFLTGTKRIHSVEYTCELKIFTAGYGDSRIFGLRENGILHFEAYVDRAH